MDDERIWDMEERLWRGGADVYETLIDDDCVMALPAEPFIYSRNAAISAVEGTPRWEDVAFADTAVARPQDGLIAIAYRADARRGGERYEAYCTTVMRRIAHDEWRVVSHSQTVPPAVGG